MNTKLPRLKRSAYVLIAVGMAVAGVMQGWLVQRVYAFPTGGQLLNRQITISSSVQDASPVSYRVAFLPASDYSVRGIIVDFCSNTPLIGDTTCTAPTDFDVGTPTVDTTPGDTGYTDIGDGTGGSWTMSALNSGRTLKMEYTGGTAPALDDGNANRYAFTLTTANNPSTLGTYYARIITYTSASGDIDSYAPGTEGSSDAEDYGGIALSTAAQINISAKVQETLVFCISGPNGYDGGGNPIAPTIGSGCSSGVQTPNITLGHGTNDILDNSATDTNDAYMQISTNAQSGINVRMKNSNACGGLSRNSGSTCEIAPAGASAVSIPAGTSALFGMFVTPGSGVTAAAPYNGGTTTYGMDNSTANNNVNSTYGSLIASSTAPLSSIMSTMRFAATATLTTPAGLYSANMTVIATGTF